MLNDLVVSSRIHRIEDEFGVAHIYNSRGFRDTEWPADLTNAVWCVGDSFTLGVSCPIEQTWPKLLEQQLSRHCINISMSGASNQWIARKSIDIIRAVNPTLLVIQWSYFHRAEEADNSLSDENRRIPYEFIEIEDQLADFDKCVTLVESNKNTTSVIHSFIPGATTIYGPEYIQAKWDSIRGNIWPDTVDFDHLPKYIVDELNYFDLYDRFELHFKYWHKLEHTLTNVNYVPMFEQLDRSADQHHYGVKTSAKFVEEIIKLI